MIANAGFRNKCGGLPFIFVRPRHLLANEDQALTTDAMPCHSVLLQDCRTQWQRVGLCSLAAWGNIPD